LHGNSHYILGIVLTGDEIGMTVIATLPGKGATPETWGWYDRVREMEPVPIEKAERPLCTCTGDGGFTEGPPDVQHDWRAQYERLATICSTSHHCRARFQLRVMGDVVFEDVVKLLDTVR